MKGECRNLQGFYRNVAVMNNRWREKWHAITEEMADVPYFLIRLAQRYNIDLTNELTTKFEKNEHRYPVEKAKGSNKKYDEL